LKPDFEDSINDTLPIDSSNNILIDNSNNVILEPNWHFYFIDPSNK
jgi:hypothetical protein